MRRDAVAPTGRGVPVAAVRAVPVDGAGQVVIEHQFLTHDSEGEGPEAEAVGVAEEIDPEIRGRGHSHAGPIGHQHPTVGHAGRQPESVVGGSKIGQIDTDGGPVGDSEVAVEHERHGEVGVTGSVVGRVVEEAPEVGSHSLEDQVAVDREGIRSLRRQFPTDRRVARIDRPIAAERASWIHHHVRPGAEGSPVQVDAAVVAQVNIGRTGQGGVRGDVQTAVAAEVDRPVGVRSCRSNGVGIGHCEVGQRDPDGAVAEAEGVIDSTAEARCREVGRRDTASVGTSVGKQLHRCHAKGEACQVEGIGSCQGNPSGHGHKSIGEVRQGDHATVPDQRGEGERGNDRERPGVERRGTGSERGGMGGHERATVERGSARVAVADRERRGAGSREGQRTSAGDPTRDREERVVAQRDVRGEIQRRGDRVGSRQIIQESRGLQRHRSTTGDLIGGRGVGEGERGDRSIRIQDNRAGAVGAESGRVIHAERAVETRGTARGIP